MGATPAQAERILAHLADAGMTTDRVRGWLETYVVRRTGPFTARPVGLLRDGEGGAVVAAAAAYAAATPDERFASFAMDGLGLEDVRRLGAARVRRTLELLLTQLQVPARVYECLATTFGDATEDTLGECLLDHRLEAIEAGLRDGGFDPWRHLESGVLRVGWL